jgi:hypothetical protein
VSITKTATDAARQNERGLKKMKSADKHFYKVCYLGPVDYKVKEASFESDDVEHDYSKDAALKEEFARKVGFCSFAQSEMGSDCYVFFVE